MNHFLSSGSSENYLPEVKLFLLKKRRQIQQQIQMIEAGDPVMIEQLPESQELGTESWQADVHAKAIVLKSTLGSLAQKIDQCLLKLKRGTYGQCEKCNQSIPVERLMVMPMASSCIFCARSTSKPQLVLRLR